MNIKQTLFCTFVATSIVLLTNNSLDEVTRFVDAIALLLLAINNW